MIRLRMQSVRFLHTTRYLRDVKCSALPAEVVVFANDRTAVCWHPEKLFPYEYSKPLPESKPLSNTALKFGEKEVESVFRREKPRSVIADELAKMTYTTKHRWFPHSREKKPKRSFHDRPYL